MICSSEKRFFTSNLLVVEDWTPNRRATESRGDVGGMERPPLRWVDRSMQTKPEFALGLLRGFSKHGQEDGELADARAEPFARPS